MNRLKMWRLERGLSQVELASAANVPRWAIQLAEMGVRLPEQRIREQLCLALGVQLDKIFLTGSGNDQSVNPASEDPNKTHPT